MYIIGTRLNVDTSPCLSCDVEMRVWGLFSGVHEVERSSRCRWTKIISDSLSKTSTRYSPATKAPHPSLGACKATRRGQISLTWLRFTFTFLPRQRQTPTPIPTLLPQWERRLSSAMRSSRKPPLLSLTLAPFLHTLIRYIILYILIILIAPHGPLD
jgi:hypothetical protein